MYAKVYEQGGDVVIAACDEELLGKTLKTDDGLEVTISKRFYGGKIVSSEELSRLFDISTIGNLFGEKVIGIAIKKGLVKDENVINIDGVPHVQFVRILTWQKKR